jgi:hypothetical protein
MGLQGGGYQDDVRLGYRFNNPEIGVINPTGAKYFIPSHSVKTGLPNAYRGFFSMG